MLNRLRRKSGVNAVHEVSVNECSRFRKAFAASICQGQMSLSVPRCAPELTWYLSELHSPRLAALRKY